MSVGGPKSVSSYPDTEWLTDGQLGLVSQLAFTEGR